MKPIQIIDRGRGPELFGTRITVFDVLPYLEKGYHHSAIAMMFGLSSRQVIALAEYIEKNRAAVMATNQKILERIAKGNPPEIEAKFVQSHANTLARLEELQRRRTEGSNHAGANGGHQHSGTSGHPGPPVGQ